MTTVLFIHGINNQTNSKANIEQTWRGALESASAASGLIIPKSVTWHAAFYGDVLYSETESWQTSKPATRPMSINSPDDDYANEDVAALYREFQRKYGLSDEQVSVELEAGEDLQAQQRMAKGIHKTWLKAIARALEKVLPSKGRRIAGAFLQQAAAYLHKPGLKEKIDDHVMTQILSDLPNDDKVVIISHSLGTVVAYDLLRRLRHQVMVRLLVTAGSPLGIEIVKNRLGTPLICLPNVETWINLADREDFVALQPTLTGKTFGCDSIVNLDQLDNGQEDAHDILKYLSHQQVVQLIAQHLS